ncbi:MAG TPA: TetR/AcrR family transcriptional regulator [Leptospiraceae bacterium]|nr:TetR/AcrR family transcriptional regulator [Leptospiraceae bacterium]HRG74822.1 TetR/AcrR family transcriptional regulator [Leptospiraceae bacterium]
MTRKPDTKAREEILEDIILVMSKKGLNNLSLRDIAKEVNTSARMLIYYFESFDNLIHSVFIHLSTKHKSSLKKLFHENPDKTFVEVSQIFIESVYFEKNKKPLLLFIELYVRALRDTENYKIFFNEVLHNWILEIESMIAPKYRKKSKIFATMILSFYRGLMLDWLATKDTDRIYESNKVFTELILGFLKEQPTLKIKAIKKEKNNGN